MGQYEANGVVADHDEEGYLTDIGQWNRDLAVVISKAENIDMTPEHWEVVDFLREYYDEYQIAPAIRILVKEMKKKFGAEKGDQKASLRAVPLRPSKASLQNRRPAEANGLHLTDGTSGVVVGAKPPSPCPSPASSPWRACHLK